MNYESDRRGDVQSFSIKTYNVSNLAYALIGFVTLIVIALIMAITDRPHDNFYLAMAPIALVLFILQFFLFKSWYIEAKEVRLTAEELLIVGEEKLLIKISDIKNYMVFDTVRSFFPVISITMKDGQVFTLAASESELEDFAEAFRGLMKSVN